VAVLQDLSGPKIRTGLLEGGQPLVLRDGDPLVIATGDFVGAAGRVSTTYAELARAVRAGDRLLVDDGRIELSVEGSDGTSIATRVVNGGVLGEHKGINAPLVALPSGALTAKDREDLRFGLSLGVDLRPTTWRAPVPPPSNMACRTCRSSPSWSGPKPSRGSTRSSNVPTP
jgi:pyruvate kinase